MRQGKVLTRVIFSRRSSTISGYNLVCGLEIHTQLNSKYKLFSLSKNNPFSDKNLPNSNVSFFDAALPGTRPVINYECVLYALKLGLALNSKINLQSHFDRKHYFYADQPQGYQITQHYKPIASGGFLTLDGRYDGISDSSKKINIIQLQLEQDTAMSHSFALNSESVLIDLNRNNVPLIELVTKPEFTDIKQVLAFIKKYQNLIRHLNISSGDMESSALRVDVNVSINDYNHVELKNLSNTSSIAKAIEFEYDRQVNLVKTGRGDLLRHNGETRGWDGNKTFKMRGKETTIDYRYIPDPELPILNLDPDIIENVRKILPEPTDSQIEKFLNQPYNLMLKDAKFLCICKTFKNLYTNEQIKNYYQKTLNFFCKYPEVDPKNRKHVINWIIHELLGNLNKYSLSFSDMEKFLPPNKMSEFLKLVYTDKISSKNGKMLLSHVLGNIKQELIQDKINWDLTIKKLNMGNLNQSNEIDLLSSCKQIIKELNDPKLIESIKNGKKKNSLKFLIGLGMKKFQGKKKAVDIAASFRKILELE